MSDNTRWLADLVTEHDERNLAAERAYDALKATGQLRSHIRLTYRAAKCRCTILEVLSFPEPVGWVIHSPRYRLAPARNAATSSESGRANNTEDGDNRWKRHIYAHINGPNHAANCAHLTTNIDTARIEADLTAGRSEVLIGSTERR